MALIMDNCDSTSPIPDLFYTIQYSSSFPYLLSNFTDLKIPLSSIKGILKKWTELLPQVDCCFSSRLWKKRKMAKSQNGNLQTTLRLGGGVKEWVKCNRYRTYDARHVATQQKCLSPMRTDYTLTIHWPSSRTWHLPGSPTYSIEKVGGPGEE